MPEASRYDELHDRYSDLLSSKAGTRYERLTAMVFKSLDAANVVIHDVRLVGASEVKHQIDVKITSAGADRHVLLECKDFDRSGELVGLAIVRDFFGVVEDVRPDEAIVLTCTGFTRDARKYANAKGIKLAVLRVFEEADWEGRIKTVILNLHVEGQPRIKAGNLDMDDADRALFNAATGATAGSFLMDGSRLVLDSGAEQTPLADLLLRQATQARKDTGLRSVSVAFPGDVWRLRIDGGPPISFRRFGFTVEFPEAITTTRVITNDRIAELILEGVGPDGIVIFADQLAGMQLDESGQVVASP